MVTVLPYYVGPNGSVAVETSEITRRFGDFMLVQLRCAQFAATIR